MKKLFKVCRDGKWEEVELDVEPGRFEIIKGSSRKVPFRSYEYSFEEMECLSECWKANKQVTPTLVAFLSHYPSDLDRVLGLILPHLQDIMDGKPFWPEKE